MTRAIIRIAQAFYGIALVVWGIQHFIFGTLRDVFFPAWQNGLPLLMIWSWLFGAVLMVAGVAIILNKRTRTAALIIAGIFLFLFLFVQIPWLLFGQPNKLYHLGLWISALKESALAGGALVLAFVSDGEPENRLLRFVSGLAPYGSIFFCFTMFEFGLSHILYAEFVVNLVPEWVGDRMLWNYVAAIALMASGILIAFSIRMRAVAVLLAIMLFSWVFLVHLPAAIANPMADRGNQVASMFDALAFTGISLMIAFGVREQRWIAQLDQLI